MTEAADRLFSNGRVHTLTPAHERVDAIAVRDGKIARVGSNYEVGFQEGVGTEVIDLDGRVVIPGFVDAHTHLGLVGHYQVDADCGTDTRRACLDRLRAASTVRDDWILGFGYDEGRWTDGGYLTCDDLDTVSEQRPVAAFREDLHLVSLNTVAFERVRDEVPNSDIQTRDGEPTGVVTEAGTDAVWEAVGLTGEDARPLLVAGQNRAHAVGVTTVHDMVRRQPIPRAYYDLDGTDDLTLRVRLTYWDDYLDAVIQTGLRPDWGSDRLRVGAVKTCADGSLGSRTAKLSAPYTDGEETGQWLRQPAALRDFADRVERSELQAAVHAIGDEAIAATLDALEETDETARHRIEHAEVLSDGMIERLADSGLVVSVQPNFLKWAREGDLYDARLGSDRRQNTNRFADLLAAGAHLAFGSDCMPLDPLFGIQQAVTAPTDGQRLTVTQAIRAYTQGGAYAGFDEQRLGTIEPGKCADFTVLSASPWEVPPDEIADIDVELTVVGGDIVYDGR